MIGRVIIRTSSMALERWCNKASHWTRSRRNLELPVRKTGKRRIGSPTTSRRLTERSRLNEYGEKRLRSGLSTKGSPVRPASAFEHNRKQKRIFIEPQ